MNSPTDWDYADLKRRMQAINRPPFTARSGRPGNHCDHCPKPPEENCRMMCDRAYVQRYGVEPS